MRCSCLSSNYIYEVFEMNLDNVKKFAISLSPDAINVANETVIRADEVTKNLTIWLNDVHILFVSEYVNFDKKIKLMWKRPAPIIASASVACIWILIRKVIK